MKQHQKNQKREIGQINSMYRHLHEQQHLPPIKQKQSIWNSKRNSEILPMSQQICYAGQDYESKGMEVGYYYAC